MSILMCGVGNCPSGELSVWGIVRVGNCPVGNCPSGELSSGELSVYLLSPTWHRTFIHHRHDLCIPTCACVTCHQQQRPACAAIYHQIRRPNILSFGPTDVKQSSVRAKGSHNASHIQATFKNSPLSCGI